MLEIKLRKKTSKNLTIFSCVLYLIFLISLFFPCDAISNEAIKDQTIYSNQSYESDKFNRTSSKFSSSKLEINDNVARAGLLYDYFSDTIFWEKNMHEAYPIASLTKMMVGLLVVEDIYAGKISWKSKVKVTREATRAGGFMVSLKSGSSISVENLLKAALISSGNDAAYLLAQFRGGTEKKFVNRMNKRASQLGMKSTRFSNATGMPAASRLKDNHSSPADLLILCKEMLKYDELLWIMRMSESSISHGGKSIKLKNHNRLVASFIEVDGLKTGYTNNAKFCLAATANKNGRRTIAIALGVKSADLRNHFVGNLFSQFYDGIGLGSLQPTTPSTLAAANQAKRPNTRSHIIHRVKSGDTLYAIAKSRHCSIEQIKSWNRIKGDTIRPGQKLKIYHISKPIHASADRESVSEVIYYKVEPGDTLWRISQKYKGISVEKLMQINGIKQAGDLKAGDTLKIVGDLS